MSLNPSIQMIAIWMDIFQTDLLKFTRNPRIEIEMGKSSASLWQKD